MKVCFMLPVKRLFIGGISSSLRTLSENMKKAGIDVVINDYSLKYDVLHILYPLAPLWPLVKLAHHKGIPVVFQVNSTYDDTVNSFLGDHVFASYVRITGKQFAKVSDALITPSFYTQKVILQENWANKNRIHVISNGVNVKNFKYSTPPPIGARAVVGALSTVMGRKGVSMFIETAKLLPKHPFVWYGKTFPFRMYSNGVKLKKIIKNKPENVFFHGYARNILKAYGMMDIFTSFSSVENEGIPPLEAAALGIPLVLRDIEVYREKFDGAALFFSNPEEAASSIEKLVKDRVLRNKNSRKARKVAESFDIKETVKKLVGVYEELKRGQK